MRRGFLIFYFLLFTCLAGRQAFYLSPVYAADSTPSADPLRSEASIKSKLEQLKLSIASKAASLKSEISQKLSNKSYIGNVKSISENFITLEASPSAKQVKINQDTVYESNIAKIKYSLKKVAVGDYVAALGDVDETQVLNAKKIVLLPPNEKKTKIVWGQIYVFGDVMRIKTREGKNVQVIFSDQTTWQKGEDKITTSKVKLNDFVIVVGSSKDEKINASFVYIIPTGGYLKPKKISTPSAQIATPATKKK